MNRVEECRLARLHKRKCAFVLLVFLLITLTGIYVSDYCINSIAYDDKKVEILQMESGKDMTITFNLFHRAINVHYGKVYNDFEYLKKKLLEWGNLL